MINSTKQTLFNNIYKYKKINNNKMLPKIKKKMKSFLMDETGSISKTNLIKGALFLTATSATVKKVKADGIPNPTSKQDFINNPVPQSGGGEWPSVFGYGCGGTEIGGRCNQPTPVYLPGDPTSSWKCRKYHCTWTCEAFNRIGGKNDDHCCTKTHHTNSGGIEIQMGKGSGHDNVINFMHTESNKGLKGVHEHSGFEGDWIIYENCPGTQTPHHNNHCQHGSHTSW
jgi:hypothetical protein